MIDIKVKKRFLFSFVLIFMLVLTLFFLTSFAFAQETNNISSIEDSEDIAGNEDTNELSSDDVKEDPVIDGESENNLDEAEKDVGDAELQKDAGLAPDSNFYFIDEFFDRFGDSLGNREEKIAEIKSMIEAGNIDAARTALENYKGFADELEKEVEPERREETRRSAVAIRNTLRDIEDEIPEESRGEFADYILDKEGKIVTAVEIASKIKELCVELSKLDPNEYSRVCKSGDDSPNWQKSLDKDLTNEQREEAKKFGRIMEECFKTSGQQCRCEEIPFPEFAKMCSVAAPLATACNIGGDEQACEELDDLEMPELPDHLQNVFDELEREIGDASYDNHIPSACKEAGINGESRSDRDKCARIMIETEAPEECRDALLAANVKSEREGREICEKIMFKLNAPQECIDAGLTDFKECGKLMFRTNAPQECIDAGLTGEQRSDEKKCREIMGGLRGKGREGQGPRGGFGGNCREIQNPEERLKCYDGAISGVGEFRDNFDGRFENREKERQCIEKCNSENKAWDFSGGNCVCREGQKFEERKEFRDKPPYDCSVVFCEEGKICSPYRGCLSPEERERELEENSVDNYKYPPGPGDPGYVDNTAKYDCSKLDCGSSPNYCDPWGGCIKGEGGYNPDGSSCPEGQEYSGSGCIPFGTGNYGFNEPTTQEPSSTPSEPVQQQPAESSPPAGTQETTSSGGITGGVIFEDNKFLDYYFKY